MPLRLRGKREHPCDKLTALGIPSCEPPASLPEALAGFVEIWNGLQLNDETPTDELLDAATRFNGPNRLAEEVLARRRDLRELALRLMQDFSLKRRPYGHYLVKAFGLTGKDVLEPIRSLLGSLDDNKSGEHLFPPLLHRPLDSVHASRSGSSGGPGEGNRLLHA